MSNMMTAFRMPLPMVSSGKKIIRKYPNADDAMVQLQKLRDDNEAKLTRQSIRGMRQTFCPENYDRKINKMRRDLREMEAKKRHYDALESNGILKQALHLIDSLNEVLENPNLDLGQVEKIKGAIAGQRKIYNIRKIVE